MTRSSRKPSTYAMASALSLRELHFVLPTSSIGWSSEAGDFVANESILYPPPGRSRRRGREASCIPPERYEGSTVPVPSDHSGSRHGAPGGVSRQGLGGYGSALNPRPCAP